MIAITLRFLRICCADMDQGITEWIMVIQGSSQMETDVEVWDSEKARMDGLLEQLS